MKSLIFALITRLAYKSGRIFGFVSKKLSEKNRLYNEKTEKTKKYADSLIYSQGSYSAFVNDRDGYSANRAPFEPVALKCCGNKDLSKYGCGIVAVYNVLFLFGKRKTVSEIVTYFERHGGFILRGAFGVNPKCIEKYLKENGFSVTRFEKIEKLVSAPSGIYIVFQWNAKQKVSKGAHFFTVISENGSLKPLNACGNVLPSDDRRFKTFAEMISGELICAYKIEPAA